MITATTTRGTTGTVAGGVSVPGFAHQQCTITITVITNLHDAVPDADAVVVVIVRTGDVADRLRDAQIAVRLVVVAGVGVRAVGERVRGIPSRTGMAGHHRGRHGCWRNRRAGPQRAGG